MDYNGFEQGGTPLPFLLNSLRKIFVPLTLLWVEEDMYLEKSIGVLIDFASFVKRSKYKPDLDRGCHHNL